MRQYNEPKCKKCADTGYYRLENVHRIHAGPRPCDECDIFFSRAKEQVRQAVEQLADEARETAELNAGRPTWEEICMDTAIKLAKRSTCKTPDRQIGCVITTSDHSAVLAWGYNGGPAKSTVHCDYDPAVEKGSRCSCAHAEMNALTKLDANNRKDLIMYVTLQPCQLCATLIVNANCFAEVVYLYDYRDKSPVFTISSARIKVRKSDYADH